MSLPANNRFLGYNPNYFKIFFDVSVLSGSHPSIINK